MPTNQREAAPASKSTKAEGSVQTPLETYLREINETALLTAADEKELAGLIADGDVRARDRMVRANLRLVVHIAKQYASNGVPLIDLVQETDTLEALDAGFP